MKLTKSAVALATFFTALVSAPSSANKTNSQSNPSTEIAKLTGVSAMQQIGQSKLELMEKLATIDFFSAKFKQKIFDQAGNELQQGSGLLSVSKPNLVNWQTLTPDESLIVSDGSNLWFYDPFVEQVSVYRLESAIANTPILLITSNDEKLWQDYNVSQLTEHRYLVSARNENARVKSLELTFNEAAKNVELVGFNILDATGQLSVVSLTNYPQEPSENLFTFTVPEGVYIDDQR